MPGYLSAKGSTESHDGKAEVQHNRQANRNMDLSWCMVCINSYNEHILITSSIWTSTYITPVYPSHIFSFLIFYTYHNKIFVPIIQNPNITL